MALERALEVPPCLTKPTCMTPAVNRCKALEAASFVRGCDPHSGAGCFGVFHSGFPQIPGLWVCDLGWGVRGLSPSSCPACTCSPLPAQCSPQMHVTGDQYLLVSN